MPANKVRTLIGEGVPRDKAIAIAYKKAGKIKKKKGKK